MAQAIFEHVSVDIPIFNANGRSLTSRLLQVATGGRLDSDPNGRVSVRALSNLSFEIGTRERVGLIGHNGAGKSTLLRALGGVYAPTVGSARVVGNVASLIDINLGINPEATGLENIVIRGALLGFRKAQMLSKVEEITNFSELGDFINLPVRTYSSGMQLRLAFAISTIVRPEILLMDEWLSVGDESFNQKAEERLIDLVDSAEILVIASHSRELLERVCNRVIWLEHGEIQDDGPAKEVLAKYFA